MKLSIWIGACAAITSITLLSCGPSQWDSNSPSLVREYPAEGVKLIAESILVGSDPSTFLQPSYLIGPTRRLLVRGEKISTRAERIRISPTHRVYLQIRLAEQEDPQTARTHLKACPVTKSWMMLANWTTAHPFGLSGRWNQQGGEFSATDCVAAIAAAPSEPSPEPAPSPKPSNTPPAVQPPISTLPEILTFDVTSWFSNSVRGRGVNFGLILTATQKVEILGDLSNSNSPRLIWIENY